MTNEEAIEILQSGAGIWPMTDRANNALNKAIKALEQEPCEDAISRQAAVYVASGACHPANIADELAKLPSVNPQEQKWIPVSEKLPDNNDDVLVYDYSDIFVAWYSGIDRNWCSADNRFDEYTPIIAWQPLPKPFEPQESEVSDADSD